MLQSLKMLHPVVTERSSGQKQIAKLAVFSKFQTHDLEVLSPNYEKALLHSIGNIAAKFEDATPCSYRDIFRTKTKNRKIGSFFQNFEPMTLKY